MTVKTSQQFIGAHQLGNLRVNLRMFNPDTDYETLVKILLATSSLPWQDIIYTADELRTNYKQFPNCDLLKDLAIIEGDDQPLAYSRVFLMEVDAEPIRTYYLANFVDPSFYGKGVQELLLEWAETRVKEISNENPTEQKEFLLSNVIQQDVAKVKVFEAMGYVNTRNTFEMKRDLENIPFYPLPTEITVRAVHPSQYPLIYDAYIEAFRDHYGFSEEWSTYERWLEEPGFQPWLWQIAWHGEQVAGCVLNYIKSNENEHRNRLRGYTESISVSRNWRGMGIAKALICRSMEMFKTLGMQEVALSVDALNPTGALRLYEGLGYITYNTMVEYRKPLNK